MSTITDLGNGEFQKEFLYEHQVHTARINTTSEPVVATIFDANGNELANMDLTQQTQADMRHYDVGDPETLLNTIIETFVNQEEMTEEEGDET